ncbi:transporter substrate-binding domain-containing protein, partial [Agathobaculum sp.]
TDEVKTSMNCSSPYATNAQVVVVPSDKADAAKDLDGVKGLSFAVEAGSAGAAAADALGLTATEVQSQADALMEVAAGTSDACVIDLLMAGAMIGEGTSYPNLVYTLDLNEANGDEPENYVVGFRKDSDLTAAFNDFYKSAYEDGTVEKLAEKYGVQEAIVAP